MIKAAAPAGTSGDIAHSPSNPAPTGQSSFIHTYVGKVAGGGGGGGGGGGADVARLLVVVVVVVVVVLLVVMLALLVVVVLLLVDSKALRRPSLSIDRAAAAAWNHTVDHNVDSPSTLLIILLIWGLLLLLLPPLSLVDVSHGW